MQLELPVQSGITVLGQVNAVSFDPEGRRVLTWYSETVAVPNDFFRQWIGVTLERLPAGYFAVDGRVYYLGARVVAAQLWPE